MRFHSFGKTDPGRKRELNEDSFAVLEEEGVFLVADGMGGHNAGEIASGIAIETIVNFFKASAEDDDMTWPYKLDSSLSLEANKLKVGIKFANRRIFRTASSNSAYAGMGTTVVSMLVDHKQENLYVAHVGDSRCYLFEDGMLSQVTEDHSLVNEYIKAGQLTLEQAKNFPHKNVIMRALGMKDNVLVDVKQVELRPNQLYICCSDGLSDMVEDSEIEMLLKKGGAVEELATTLVDRANSNGGKDNITVVLLQTVE